MRCRVFDSPADALEEVLKTQPRLLAIGETHAQKGSEGVRSATSRFTEQLLPKLQGRSSDLILELWVADGRCGKKETKVAEKQKPVAEKQVDTNQNEFVTLRHRSKELGITPHVLRPSCEQYDRILAAGPDGIEQMLTMITQLTAAMAKQMLDKSDKMLVAYGGAMHNDLAPRPGRESWSFGPELDAHTNGKTVELDLIVREYVKDTDAWKALPWYPHFDREKLKDKTLLYSPSPRSYVLIFPAG
jgi:hypothetical protein